MDIDRRPVGAFSMPRLLGRQVAQRARNDAELRYPRINVEAVELPVKDYGDARKPDSELENSWGPQ